MAMIQGLGAALGLTLTGTVSIATAPVDFSFLTIHCPQVISQMSIGPKPDGFYFKSEWGLQIPFGDWEDLEYEQQCCSYSFQGVMQRSAPPPRYTTVHTTYHLNPEGAGYSQVLKDELTAKCPDYIFSGSDGVSNCRTDTSVMPGCADAKTVQIAPIDAKVWEQWQRDFSQKGASRADAPKKAPAYYRVQSRSDILSGLLAAAGSKRNPAYTGSALSTVEAVAYAAGCTKVAANGVASKGNGVMVSTLFDCAGGGYLQAKEYRREGKPNARLAVDAERISLREGVVATATYIIDAEGRRQSNVSLTDGKTLVSITVFHEETDAAGLPLQIAKSTRFNAQ